MLPKDFLVFVSIAFFRRGVRVAEGARLESVYALIAYRGFESLSLRHLNFLSY